MTILEQIDELNQKRKELDSAIASLTNPIKASWSCENEKGLDWFVLRIIDKEHGGEIVVIKEDDVQTFAFKVMKLADVLGMVSSKMMYFKSGTKKLADFEDGSTE